MLAAQEMQSPTPPMLTDREWSASVGVPAGVDRLLWLEPSVGVVTYVMEELDG